MTRTIVHTKRLSAILMASVLACAIQIGFIQEAHGAKPVVNKPAIEKESLEVGESMRVSVTAVDPDNDLLRYEWSAVSGTIDGEGREITYTAPGTRPVAKVDTITVDITDGENIITKSVIVPIEELRTPVSLHLSPSDVSLTQFRPENLDLLLTTTPDLKVGRVDVRMTYNPRFFKFHDADDKQPGIQVLPSNLCTKIHLNIVQETDGPMNEVLFSCDTASINGQDQPLARLMVTPLEQSTAAIIDFDFLLGDESDTNVFEVGNTNVDKLQVVKPAKYLIAFGTAPEGTGGPVIEEEVQDLQDVGTPVDTMILIALICTLFLYGGRYAYEFVTYKVD